MVQCKALNNNLKKICSMFNWQHVPNTSNTLFEVIKQQQQPVNGKNKSRAVTVTMCCSILLTKNATIEAFNEILPSLNEVFIKTGRRNQIQHASFKK